MDYLPQDPAILVSSVNMLLRDEEFNGYVACLHQLYLMGAAIQLKRMGYRMTKMN